MQNINQLFAGTDLLQQLDQMQDSAPEPLPLADFLYSLYNLSFQERHFRWVTYLSSLRACNSQYLQATIEKFLEFNPFSSKHWLELISLVLKQPKSKANGLKTYQIALAKNPRSFVLWNDYLSWLRKEISKSDPKYLLNEYDKATRLIGSHYLAAPVFEHYFTIETDLVKKYQSVRKALVSPLKEIDRMYDLIVQWLQTLSLEEAQILGEQQNLDNVTTGAQRRQELIQRVKAELRRLYEPTKQHVELRMEYEKELEEEGEQYKPHQSIQVWRSHLAEIRSTGNQQLLALLYERTLITHCDSEALWEEYFTLLEHEDNYHRILYLLRSHSTFFINLSRQITYYWLELEERQSPARARQLYIELERTRPVLEIFLKHIQLEMRSKDYNNAKEIYKTILTTFTHNINIVSYVVLEYAQFSSKYFRDIQSSKQLLTEYFQSYPYSEQLFIGYLEFFIKQIEYKQGFKQGKEVYDQFLRVLIEGLRRAWDNSDRYECVKNIAMKKLRDYIPSIYLIKGAERKIGEMENQKRATAKKRERAEVVSDVGSKRVEIS